MADKITSIKIKQKNGSYTTQIPVSVSAQNVQWDGSHSLLDILGSVDVNVGGKGNVQHQFDDLYQNIDAFTDDINSEMTDFTNSTNQSITNFTNSTNQSIADFTNTANQNFTDFTNATNQHLSDVLGNISTETKGTVQAQMDKLQNDMNTFHTQMAAEIGTDVSDWLQQNVTPAGSMTMVDNSLTISDAAADAKAVGDALTSLNGSLRDVTSNMFHINFPVSNMEIGAILETTGENGTNKTSRIRSTMYFPVKKGDVIRFLDTVNVKTYVGGYMLNGQTYTYIGVFKHLSESDISEITIPENCYIRYTFGYIDDRAIGTDFNSRANLCKTMDVVRRSATKTEILDGFEVGSLLNDVSRGLLYNSNNFTRYRTENLYDVSGSDVVQIEVPAEDVETASKVNIILYNSDFTELSIVDGVFNADNTFGCLTDGYSYANALIFYGEDFQAFKSGKVSANKSLLTSKLPANGNDSTLNAIGFNYMVQGGVMSTGRLILPPDYDKSGKAVPLVVYVHGSNAMLNWNSPVQASYINFFRYLANEGFAIFDCYPWTTKADVLSTDTYSPIMIPLNCRAYLQGIKYVGKRFNVDINNTCLLCKSQGGLIGHWAYIQSEFPFRAVGLFAPTADLSFQKTNTVFYNSACRQAIINTVDLNGTDAEKEAFVSSGLITDATVSTFMGKNKNKFISMMPMAQGIQGSASADELYAGSINTLETVPEWMLEEGLPQRESSYDLIPYFAEKETYAKNAKCPVKFWCAFDDEATSSYGNYAIHRYLLNGGSDSEFRILPVGTGGHHAMDSSPNALKSSGLTHLGIPYTDIPTAYVEFAQFASRYVR